MNCLHWWSRDIAYSFLCAFLGINVNSKARKSCQIFFTWCWKTMWMAFEKTQPLNSFAIGVVFDFHIEDLKIYKHPCFICVFSHTGFETTKKFRKRYYGRPRYICRQNDCVASFPQDSSLHIIIIYCKRDWNPHAPKTTI